MPREAQSGPVLSATEQKPPKSSFGVQKGDFGVLKRISAGDHLEGERCRGILEYQRVDLHILQESKDCRGICRDRQGPCPGKGNRGAQSNSQVKTGKLGTDGRTFTNFHSSKNWGPFRGVPGLSSVGGRRKFGGALVEGLEGVGEKPHFSQGTRNGAPGHQGFVTPTF